jgi:hypothetical protein
VFRALAEREHLPSARSKRGREASRPDWPSVSPRGRELRERLWFVATLPSGQGRPLLSYYLPFSVRSSSDSVSISLIYCGL